MKITSQVVLGMAWAVAGLIGAVRAGDLDFSNPDNIASPPQGSLGFPSRDPNLDALPGFRNPPPGYGEVPFWWWTGDPLDKERLLWQIEQLHAKGIAGMQVNYAHEDSTGWPTYAAEPTIFSDAWWEVWKFVAGECSKRGMGIGLSGYTLDWPNGKSLISSTIYNDPEIQGREIAIARKQNVKAGQAFIRDGKTVLSTEDLRYTLEPPTSDTWRTSRNTTGLSTPDPTNVHKVHRVGAPAELWSKLVGQIERLIPCDVKAARPIKAMHRKVGPRDVYMVMGAPKKSMAEFRAKGKAELWDPWTGATKPLRVLSETATGTKVELPLEDYEAQIVVFTPTAVRGSRDTAVRGSPDPAGKATGRSQEPGRPAVAGFGEVGRPAPNAEEISLDGEWEFELKPTMDNRFGDFRLPATDKIIGPEARIFRHTVESGDATAWREPTFDDSRWERVTYDFGPQFWLLGPLANDALEAQLAKLTRVDPQEAVDVDGRPIRWRPYSFSWRMGLEGDPGHQGFHGLKENVTDHFLCLGQRARALNETKYVTEQAGSRYYLWTSATVDRPTTAHIVSSARQEGEQPHASEVLEPTAVFLNGTRVEDLRESVSLRAGANPILVRYDQAGRGYFVLKRDENDTTPARRTPLAMTWFDDPSLIRFDVHAGAKPAEWFRFTAPPGLRAMTVTAKGTVETWADGQPMRAAGQGRFEAATPLSRAATVALRVMPETGFCGAAVFPDPVRLECGPGVTTLGDWSKTGALECYSGGAWYRKTVALTPQ